MNNYQNINSLEQLRNERIRLSERINYKKTSIHQNYSYLRSLFSVNGLTSYIASKMTSFTQLSSYVLKGYDFVRSLFATKQQPMAEVIPKPQKTEKKKKKKAVNKTTLSI